MIFGLSYAFFASQILVAIAIVTDFISFQFKERKHVLLMLTVSSILITIHYFLLGKTNAGILLVISTLSFLTASFSHNKRWMYLFLFLYIIPIVFNYTEVYDLIIFAALYIILIGKFQKDDKWVRIFIMFGALLMITYNVIIFTPIGVLLESLFFSSNVVGYYRHYIKKRLN